MIEDNIKKGGNNFQIPNKEAFDIIYLTNLHSNAEYKRGHRSENSIKILTKSSLTFFLFVVPYFL